MRAYRKTTQHPFCVYLSEAEAVELVINSEIAQEHSDDVPGLQTLAAKLGALLADPKRERA